MKRPTLLAILVTAACGGGGSNGDHVVLDPDAGVDAAIDAPPLSVTVQTGGTPTLIKYRDGSGPWLTPTDGGMNTYSLEITGPYEIAMVCGSAATGYQTTLWRATPADGAQQFVFCSNPGGAGVTDDVTGQMLQPGTVAMGATDSGSTAPWAFDLPVAPGPHELVAFDAERVVIRRGLMITGTEAEPSVDLAQGDLFTTLPFTLGGVTADETVTAETDLFTANDFTVFNSTTAAFTLVPANALDASDIQFLFTNAATSTSDRYVDFQYDANSPTSATLPPLLTGVTLTGQGAAWSTLPAGDLALFIQDAAATPPPGIELLATQRWIGTATSLAIDLAIPGYQDAWKPDPLDCDVTFAVNSLDSTTRVTSGTEVTQFVGPATPPPPQHHRMLRERSVAHIIGARRKILP